MPAEPGTHAGLHGTSRTAPARLAGDVWDVLIVGGGLAGATLARETAHRGLRTALVEHGRIGGAATGAWHGLLTDGGHADDPLRTSAELRRERANLLASAPHLVRPLSLVVPDWHDDPWPRRRRLAALLLAELGGPHGNVRSLAGRNKHEVLAAEAGLRARGLTGGIAVRTWNADGPTLALALGRSAALAGAAVATHTEALGWLRTDGRVAGARVRDLLDGSEHDVRASVTILAGGVDPERSAAPGPVGWCRRIALLQRRLDVQSSLLFTSALDGSTLLLTREGEHVFAGPVGPVSADDTSFAWVTALLRGINAALPAARLSHGDVLGVRTAPIQPSTERSETVEPGLRLFTSPRPVGLRALAASLATELAAGLPPSSQSVASSSALPGGDARDLEPIASLGREAGLPAETIAHCLTLYGTEAAAIFNLAQRDRALRTRLHPESPAIAAEVCYAVRRGFAVTIADVLDGALGLDLRTRDGGAAAAAACAARLADELRWSPGEADAAAAAHVAMTARAASAIAMLGA